MPAPAMNKKGSALIGPVLFFWLVVVPAAFAALPVNGTISPSSGSVAPNAYTTFTCAYSDADGWANLKDAYFLISASSTTLANSAYLYYNQNTNKLYLRNDTNTAWLGGYAPGSSYYIENSKAKIWCAFSSAIGSGSTLTVKFYVTFKSVYSGKSYNSYLRVVDDNENSTAWEKKGTFIVNNKPLVGTVNPFSGYLQINMPLIFNTTYTDFDGWQNLQGAYLLINTAVSGLNCAYLYYNQNTNMLYLRNDGNTAWLGGYAPGTAYTIQNSYVKLDCSKTSVSNNGTIFTVNWNITFKSVFTGVKNLYLYVKDDAGQYNGWAQKGSVTILQNSTPPVICTLTPVDKSTFTETQAIPVSACANSGGLTTLEFQVSVNGAVIKPWAASSTSCTCNGTGISFNYSWQTASGNNGSKTIRVEARNSAIGTISKETKVYLFRKALGPP